MIEAEVTEVVTKKMKHSKLVGGSYNTVKHDLEKIKTAKEEVKTSNKEITKRAAKHRQKDGDTLWWQQDILEPDDVIH